MKKEDVDALYNTYYSYMLGFATKTTGGNKSEATEMVHKLYCNLIKWDIKEIENPKTYLCQSIINMYRTSKKKQLAQLPAVLELKEAIMSNEESRQTAEDNLIAQDRIDIVLDFIETLPKQQKAIAFQICKGIRMSSIAEETAIPYNTVKANWRHIAIKLKEELNNKGESFLWKVNI